MTKADGDDDPLEVPRFVIRTSAFVCAYSFLMTNSKRQLSSHLPGEPMRSVAMPTLALVLSGILGICCYLLAGNTLDLFIGGVFFAALLTPPLSAFAGRLPGGIGISIAISIGIGCSWLMPVFSDVIGFGQFAMCLLVLLTFAVMLMATVELLIQLGCSPIASSAIVVVASLAWLAWPIWLSTSLSGSQLHLSVLLHPLFVINHIVDNLGIWTEQQRAYGLTNLGQDVQYQMPTSALPGIAVQCGIAGLASIICLACSRIAPRSMNQIDTDANAAKAR